MVDGERATGRFDVGPALATTVAHRRDVDAIAVRPVKSFRSGATSPGGHEQLPSHGVRWWPAVVLLALAACGGGDEAAPSTTQRLAPSQIAASTVARPETPPPCDPVDLVWWTAQATSAGTTSTAIVRVRNDGDTWCEIDIAGSPTLSVEAEPNVWLEPGEWGDLVVGSDDDRCSPTVFDTVEVVVSHVIVEVPSIGVAACEPSLLAFYVAEPPAGPCTDLDALVVDDAVVVRNRGFESCELGVVIGPGTRDDAAPAVTALAGGDVVAIDVVPAGVDCATPAESVVFDVAGTIEVAGLEGCPLAGAAHPWFGSVSSPALPGDVLDDLDPFA